MVLTYCEITFCFFFSSSFHSGLNQVISFKYLIYHKWTGKACLQTRAHKGAEVQVCDYLLGRCVPETFSHNLFSSLGDHGSIPGRNTNMMQSFSEWPNKMFSLALDFSESNFSPSRRNGPWTMWPKTKSAGLKPEDFLMISRTANNRSGKPSFRSWLDSKFAKHTF